MWHSFTGTVTYELWHMWHSHCDIPIRNVTFPTASWPHGRAAVEARSTFSLDLSPCIFTRPIGLYFHSVMYFQTSSQAWHCKLADAIAISDIWKYESLTTLLVSRFANFFHILLRLTSRFCTSHLDNIIAKYHYLERHICPHIWCIQIGCTSC